MARNRSNIHYNQQTHAMSPSHTYTVGADANPPFADEEDLDDICPVCDGECTCANRSQPLSSDRNGSATLASPSTTLVPSLQSLKIKLTPGMLSKARAAQAQANTKKSKHLQDAMFDIADVGEGSSTSARPGFNPPLGSHASASGSVPSVPKRRGRPPKAARNVAKLPVQDRPGASVNEANTLPSSSLSSSSSRLPKKKGTQSRASSKAQSKVAKSKGKFTTLKKGKAVARSSPLKRKATALSDNDTESDLTDLDEQGLDDDEIDDAESMHYPTFMSASVMSTSTFSEDSETASSSSGFDSDSDSSLEAEEENFILNEERRHEKARVRRELLGGDGHKRKDGQNDWVIRSRKQSVDPEEVEMEVDSDATEDEEDDEEEGDDESDEDDEMDESGPGGYAGVATGWSEDEGEESSFDADLFFANLSDSTADGDSTSDDEFADPSDADAAMIGPAEAGGRVQPDGLPFEVSHGWDGQIVFTNGVGEGHALLDHDFELSAAQLVDDSASPSQDSDFEMQTTEGENDGEYEDMDDQQEGESDDGDTTDDDYVDNNGLPTQRMLELFRWPASLSSIDPMSTVSPTVSPSPQNRRRKRSDTTSSKDPHSPRPADILAGKIFWADSDEQDRDDSSEGRRASSIRGGPPTMGRFEAGQDHPRRAILNGLNKDVPSPFPRVKHKKRSSSYSDCFDQFRGRPLTRPHSLSISSTSSGVTPLSSDEPSGQSSSDHPLGPPIDLHDVVDVSFLEPDPVDPLGLSHTSASENEAGGHMQSAERWGHIPMGTFRRTRESGAIIGDGASTSWTAETPRVKPADAPFTPASASRILKSSPFSEIAWQSRPPKGTRRRLKPSKNLAISPVILPVRDGDRTPTMITHPSSTNSPPNEQQRKSRKEQRRESKMKRKSLGPVHHQHQHRQRQHQHFHHSHHPNMKSRSTNAIQRTNFFNSPTSSVPPLNL